jgi:hypothetical protein
VSVRKRHKNLAPEGRYFNNPLSTHHGSD